MYGVVGVHPHEADTFDEGTLPALAHIAGHEWLDTREEVASDDPERRVPRKRDPGPLFPWPRVLAAVPLQELRG